MICPVCREEMLVLEFHLIEIDWCSRCAGVWLDSGELELLGEKAGALQPKLLAALEQEASGQAGRKRRCPVCFKRLQQVRQDDEGTIVVDRCPAQHGLWFDEGELRAVIAAAGADRNNVLASFLAELGPQETKEPDS